MYFSQDTCRLFLTLYFYTYSLILPMLDKYTLDIFLNHLRIALVKLLLIFTISKVIRFMLLHTNTKCTTFCPLTLVSYYSYNILVQHFLSLFLILGVSLIYLTLTFLLLYFLLNYSVYVFYTVLLFKSNIR